MAEVRFKIKGQEQETVFSPVQGEKWSVPVWKGVDRRREENSSKTK